MSDNKYKICMWCRWFDNDWCDCNNPHMNDYIDCVDDYTFKPDYDFWCKYWEEL
jgi:hypothetical protein